jgi:hypothetical protein
VISCYSGTATFPTGARATIGLDVDGSTGYQAIDLQIPRNFELGDMGSMYLQSTRST